jgi:hypothetical protein
MKRINLDILKCEESCEICNSVEKMIRDAIESLDYRNISIDTGKLATVDGTPHPVILVDGEIWKMGDLNQREIKKGLKEVRYGKKGTAIPRIMAIVGCGGCKLDEAELKKAQKIAAKYKDLILYFEIPRSLEEISDGELDEIIDSFARIKMQPGRRFIALDGCRSFCATAFLTLVGLEPTRSIEVKAEWKNELLEVILDIIKNYCDCQFYENLDPVCNTCPMSKVCFTLKRVELAIEGRELNRKV